MEVKYGIVFEGSQDLPALEALIERLINECECCNFSKILDPTISATDTYKTVLTQINIMTETRQADVLFIFADQDNKNEKKRSCYVRKLNDKDSNLMEKVFLAIPNPHFEKWLLCDEPSVVDYFSIHNTDELSTLKQQRSPKECLQHYSSLKQEYFGDTKTNLVNLMDLDLIERTDREFKHFRKDFKSFCNRNSN